MRTDADSLSDLYVDALLCLRRDARFARFFKGVTVAEVLHDDHCPKLSDGPCICDPDILLTAEDGERLRVHVDVSGLYGEEQV